MNASLLPLIKRMKKWVENGDGFRTGTITCFGSSWGVKLEDHLNQDINGYGDSPSLKIAILLALTQVEE